MRAKFKDSKIYKYLSPFTSWKFTISFGTAWMITNGWAYILAFSPIPIWGWLRTAAITYVAFLYLPITPEKLVTIPMAIWLHVKLFRKDTKTSEKLEVMYNEAKGDWDAIKRKTKSLFKGSRGKDK